VALTETLHPSSVEPFSSLSELRNEHAALLRAVHTASGRLDLREKIFDFLTRAQATGMRIEEPVEREAAQGILDYWLATLLADTDSTSVQSPPFALAPFDKSLVPDLSNKACPFMGLAAFEEKDADRFFGREEAVTTLLGKVARERVVMVVGPSGSGKSSIVLAGLVPRLKASAIPGSEGWRYLPIVVPGSDPLVSLLFALCPSGTDAKAWIAEHRPKLQSSSDHFRELVEGDGNAKPTLLVVDQFEEVLTLCENHATRERFAEALMHFVERGSGKNRVILTVREDFVSEATRLSALSALRDNPEARFSPPPLSVRELRRVIEKPAELVGLKFDQGIVDDLIKEVAGEATALPMLQFALLKLWNNRDRNRITWDVYRRVGSPREALKRTADAVFAELKTHENEQAAERIFVALVQPTVGAEFVRRRVRRETLRRLEAPDRVDRILDRFVEAGLIRKTPGVEPDDDRFEVVHEALIRNWPRLGQWLARKRDRSEKELQLVSTAKLWRESGRSPGYLLTDSALVEARQYARASPELAELVAASEARERRRQMRQRGWIALLAVLLAIAAFALLFMIMAIRRTGAALEQASAALEEASTARDRAAEALTAYLQQDSTQIVVAEAVKSLVTNRVLRREELPETLRELLPDPNADTLLTIAPIVKRYDSAFLGVSLPLPVLTPAQRRQAHRGGVPLHYLNYSLAFHLQRASAIYAAANHDRSQQFFAPRGRELFSTDPRVPADRQLNEAFYRGSGFDRGHLVSRPMIMWGDKSQLERVGGSVPEVIQAAFNVYTNIVPQYRSFNLGAWSAIEQWILIEHNPSAERVTVFSGPVLRDDDYLVRGARIPRSFWKIAVSRQSPKSDDLVVDAFLANQYDPQDPRRPLASSSPVNAMTYRVTVSAIERVTGLDFGVLKKFEAVPAAN
jgi:DNA/RNA endonuclease G (NUC1)/energy-coupling factor transporter ATP-binding protein EcfA2